MRPRKRSFAIKGHRTSISLETPFWEVLKEIADEKHISLAALVGEIDSTRADKTGLSTSVRLYVLEFLRARLRDRPLS
ncbi:MAG: ribbon-helix-helix domain-containing protein [Hyphomicrobiaceae bacterium]|nr:ribbon-helix-helix domain-containing protein [Hyphomicrobiaceae bacterium]